MAEMILKLNNNVFNTINKIVSSRGINLKDYLLLPAKTKNVKKTEEDFSEFETMDDSIMFLDCDNENYGTISYKGYQQMMKSLKKKPKVNKNMQKLERYYNNSGIIDED
ncbi:MAG: hypothetical protein Ta2D_00390 [Rickettsiales bacterium]|nr:MAG: hypothetical protein Ta2D_00390 [Rickettsiales bacterium]